MKFLFITDIEKKKKIECDKQTFGFGKVDKREKFKMML